MNIILASENKSKILAVKRFFPQCNITCVYSNSEVSNKPVNNEVLLGAYNRVKNIKQNYDIAIGIEGGYISQENNYYLVDICCIKDKYGYKFGHGPFFTISKNMFKCVSENISLNTLIKDLIGYSSAREFKQYLGVVAFLSDGKTKRDYGNFLAINSAINSDYMHINNYKLDFSKVIELKGEKFNILDEICSRNLNQKFQLQR